MNMYEIEKIYGESFEEFATRLIITSVRRGCVTRGIYEGVPLTSLNCNSVNDVREQYLSYDKDVVIKSKEVKMMKVREDLPEFDINNSESVTDFLYVLYHSKVSEYEFKNIYLLLKKYGYNILMDYLEENCLKRYEANEAIIALYNGREFNKDLIEHVLIGQAMTDMKYSGYICMNYGSDLDKYQSVKKQKEKVR